MYKDHMRVFWNASEIDLTVDVVHWRDELDDNERHFISHVLAFFAASDGIVLENLAVRFMKDVQVAEARCFYGFQIAMENVHAEVYSLLIDTLITDRAQRTRLFNAVDHIDCVQKKAQWAIKWIDSSESFATRVLAFAAVEGIFFSGSFCAIYWLKKRGLMPGLAQSNELISRDEGLHTKFACLLYSMLRHKLPDQVVLDLIHEAVEIEKEFVCDALPVRLVGMNATLMAQYIEYVADVLLDMIGLPASYHVENPFEFMVNQSLDGYANFFERKESSYEIPGVGRSRDEHVFAVDADF